ncbi:MAG: LysR family transcriptional regulator [Alphaproteobacteria bacterium]|nr:LysR family transcriptional regulator [Alphaproteobacteria bacterium]
MIFPTLRQLSYLLAVKSAGSFSLAAERSYVTQSTLSAGIKELEAITGCTLVDRSTRHAHLTARGRRLPATPCAFWRIPRAS